MVDEERDTSQDTGLIEKAFLMGVGAVLLAKEKTEELADELVRRGTLTRDQTDSFVNRVASQAEEAGRSARSAVAHEAERAVAGVGLASAKDIEEIRAELTEIKGLLASLRPAGGVGSDEPPA